MGRSTVDLVEYSAAWPVEFSLERDALADALGETALVIEHIGSTAVPGLVAKPTIDIAVGVRAIDELVRSREALERLGYEWRTGFHDDHRFLRKIVGDERTHHLHVIVYPSREFDDWIAFRDHLRAHPEAARAYADAKQTLAKRFHDDRGGYGEAKTEIVRRLLDEATRGT